MKKLSVDVGGTNTDAVLMDDHRFIDGIKIPSQLDIEKSILAAIDHLQDKNSEQFANLDCVTLGTTQFTNAVIQRKYLTPVMCLRCGLPSGRGLPPGLGWPDDLRDATITAAHYFHGGHLYSGQPISEFSVTDRNSLINLLKQNVSAPIAIASPFSPLIQALEEEIAELIASLDPERPVTLSHQMGGLGLIERENAAILNAALRPYARDVVTSYTNAFLERGIRCPFLISQNDGTLMSANRVIQFPALTFASGPTNSIQGAAELLGIKEAVVIDVGGTTSDIGVLQKGQPRRSNQIVQIESVRTNFRMPDLVSIGLGGGTIVHDNGDFGPESLGFELKQRAKAFGGDVITLTDIAIARGRMLIGQPELLKDIPTTMIEAAETHMRAKLLHHVDVMKGDNPTIPVIVVGGGAEILRGVVPGDWQFVDEEISGLVNAIGASTAQASGYAEMIINYDEESRESAISRVSSLALENLEASGGNPLQYEIIDVDEAHVPYLGENWFRLKVILRGELASRIRLDHEAEEPAIAPA